MGVDIAGMNLEGSNLITSKFLELSDFKMVLMPNSGTRGASLYSNSNTKMVVGNPPL